MAIRIDHPIDGPGGCGNISIPRIWKGDLAYGSIKPSLFI
jgi:hypothetical protein